LGIYYAWDRWFAYPSEAAQDLAQDAARTGTLSFEGLTVNVPILIGVVLAVALLDPSRPIPYTGWHPWPYLREVVQLGLAALSLALGQSEVREKNQFNYNPIIEVAALFVGIFITMQPALSILRAHGNELGISSPFAFFWATGGLSALLDNAPTYLVFFETADVQFAGQHIADLIQQDSANARLANQKLVGISLGAVFLGAMTYIGNGPNFMVRAIAEEAGVKMPTFFGYCLYSVSVLTPVFLVVSYLFLGT
jgi:Na+/H+ antiporter NhaD/arsenite permease-like protein